MRISIRPGNARGHGSAGGGPGDGPTEPNHGAGPSVPSGGAGPSGADGGAGPSESDHGADRRRSRGGDRRAPKFGGDGLRNTRDGSGQTGRPGGYGPAGRRPGRWSPWRRGGGYRVPWGETGPGGVPAGAGNPRAGVEGRAEAAAREEGERRRRIQEALADLDALVGLEKVKSLVKELQAYVEIQRLRRTEGLAADSMSLHMIFQGNPGTGKTTVARTLGRIFRETGVLTKGHIIEAERADLVGEYIGHTAQKTREVLRQASGGILFVDEAYSLARGGEKDFGKEAIDTLVKSMEDNRDKLLIILAGYPDEMAWFVSQNPGLRSRLPIKMSFPDYTPEELMEIALIMLEERQYELTGLAYGRLRHLLGTAARDYPKGNARTVRNLIEGAVRRQAVRLSGKPGPLSRTDLKTIDDEDLKSLMASPEYLQMRGAVRPEAASAGAFPPYGIPTHRLNGFPRRL